MGAEDPALKLRTMPPKRAAWFARPCANCGQRFGDHAAGGSACPPAPGRPMMRLDGFGQPERIWLSTTFKEAARGKA